MLICLVAACQGSPARPPGEAQPGEDLDGCIVSSPPAELAFDPFYQKYCDADGIPIISSAEVDDLALQLAYDVVMNMLVPISEVRQELVAKGAYFGVIGMYERLTEIPEYAGMDSEYWDRRARGLGGGQENPFTTVAEENLLCLTWDRYYGESIAVHEFAHTISLAGLGDNFEPRLAEFTGLYETATQQGLWANTYAGGDIQEYWAEGVQDYFNANVEAIPTDGVHNFVNTRAELEEYDPGLFAFIDAFFHGYDWTPTCPNWSSNETSLHRTSFPLQNGDADEHRKRGKKLVLIRVIRVHPRPMIIRSINPL